MNHLASAEARGLNLELIGRFCFNPLDRGNLYQIKPKFHHKIFLIVKFQSPRSGKFVSDMRMMLIISAWFLSMFQSPRSGKFVSDEVYYQPLLSEIHKFQSPRSGKFVSDLLSYKIA